jgi:hypothetical protein
MDGHEAKERLKDHMYITRVRISSSANPGSEVTWANQLVIMETLDFLVDRAIACQPHLPIKGGE